MFQNGSVALPATYLYHLDVRLLNTINVQHHVLF